MDARRCAAAVHADLHGRAQARDRSAYRRGGRSCVDEAGAADRAGDARPRRAAMTIEAVLFHLGHTLMDWVWDEDLLVRGHREGLAAIGRDDEEAAEALTARFL